MLCQGRTGGTDLGALSLVEWWAADGRAHEHSAHWGAAAVVACALCNPGRARLWGRVGESSRGLSGNTAPELSNAYNLTHGLA